MALCRTLSPPNNSKGDTYPYFLGLDFAADLFLWESKSGRYLENIIIHALTVSKGFTSWDLFFTVSFTSFQTPFHFVEAKEYAYACGPTQNMVRTS